MCYAGLQCGLSHKGWDIIDNSSGRPDIPLYHLRTLPPYITKNASPKARKSQEVVAGFASEAGAPLRRQRRIRPSRVDRPNWKAECAETCLLRLERGKGCKALPIATMGRRTVRQRALCLPSGNSVASTSGTIPPFHHLCEGALPWYHTSFST